MLNSSSVTAMVYWPSRRTDWYSALTLLRREPAHGWRLGLVGRAKIREGYTTESAVARLVSLFVEIACG
jgi:hypothetical protein